MKGFLSYLVLWIIGKEKLSGAEIAAELGKRRGHKPSPGTIYPVLKELRAKGLISVDGNKKYSLTKEGRVELKSACAIFCSAFYDMKEMLNCCK